MFCFSVCSRNTEISIATPQVVIRSFNIVASQSIFDRSKNLYISLCLFFMFSASFSSCRCNGDVVRVVLVITQVDLNTGTCRGGG